MDSLANANILRVAGGQNNAMAGKQNTARNTIQLMSETEARVSVSQISSPTA